MPFVPGKEYRQVDNWIVYEIDSGEGYKQHPVASESAAIKKVKALNTQDIAANYSNQILWEEVIDV